MRSELIIFLSKKITFLILASEHYVDSLKQMVHIMMLIYTQVTNYETNWHYQYKYSLILSDLESRGFKISQTS